MSGTRLSAQLAAIALALSLFAGCATFRAPAPGPASQPQAAGTVVDQADAALREGHAGTALKQLSGLPAATPPGIEARALDVEARAQLALGNRPAAAEALARRVPLLPPPARAAEHQRIVAILAGMGAPTLAQLYPTLADSDPVKPYAQEALRHTGAVVPRTLPQLNEPVGTFGGSGAPQGYRMPAHVALLLPQTGPVALAAAAVREGFFTAYFRAASGVERRPTLRVYDTGGTPDGALAAYRQAVADGASLVVGPLSRPAVGAVFAQPQLPVPVLALNHPQGNQPLPPGSAEFALLPEAEGAQLAARMTTLGLHAAIVFRDDSANTDRIFRAFRTQFQSLGGQIANDVVLPQGAVDFESQVQAALAGSGSATGIVALLRPEQARLLLPQLRVARSTLPVFSTSMVYSGDQNTVANGDLDGVQFCDEPWLYDAQAGLPGHAALASLLPAASGPAARLFGFGMDAYALVPYLGWLREHPGSYLPGATGELTMDRFGHVQRTPIWVQFQGGTAQPIAADLDNPAPAKAAPGSVAPASASSSGS